MCLTNTKKKIVINFWISGEGENGGRKGWIMNLDFGGTRRMVKKEREF